MALTNMSSLGENLLYGSQARGQSLKNKEQQQQLKVNPDMLMAELAYKRAQTPYVQSQTALNQATIPLLPEKFMAQGLMAQARISQARTAASNSVRNWQQTDEGRKITAENPQLAAQIEQQIMQQAMLSTGEQFGAPSPQGGGLTAPPPQQNQNMPAPTNQKLPMSQEDINKLKQMFTPEQITQDVQNVAQQAVQKKVTDVDTRKRNLFATNIEKTLGRINVDDLTKYAGDYGGFQNVVDTGLAAIGKEPKSFDDYNKAVADTKYLTTQVRQFYGDSIQPSAVERLGELTNPAMWKNNPKLAKELFNEGKQVLEMEMKTYRDAMKSTDVYQGKESQGAAPDLSQMSDDELKKIAGR